MAKVHERKMKPAEAKALAKVRNQPVAAPDTRKVKGKPSIDESSVPTWDRFSGELDALPELSAEYITLAEERKRIEDRQKEIRDQVQGMLEEVDEKSVRGDFFVATRVVSHKSTKIDHALLLEQGVHDDTIRACIVGGEEYSFIKISTL